MNSYQQKEEIIIEHAIKSVVVQPITTTTIEECTNNDLTNLMMLQNCATDKNSTMNSSVVSILDDSTPSDSGIQLLDSISSSGLNESIMSNSGFEFDLAPIITTNCATELQQLQPIEYHEAMNSLPDLLQASEKPFSMTKSDIDNSNVDILEVCAENIPDDEMKTSTCSTFDTTTENIVYRRKAKKSQRPHSSTGPKKRVSFHEDILKNTKTDNIHIEHGFITYKGYSKKNHPQIARYSWCSEGDGDEYNENKQYYYRNACSDVLDYGKADLYEKQHGNNCIQYDNSGIFEYGPQNIQEHSRQQQQQQQPSQQNENRKDEFYKCNCSSSNSSLDSGDSNDNKPPPPAPVVQKRNYGQAKSNSCDCIGQNNNNNNNNNQAISINENCYYSEPNIETLDDSFDHIKPPKSVWSKEKKPKSSCLKSGKRQNWVIEEYDISTKVKTFNVHQLPNNIIDNGKHIFGSLKNIFAMPLPERGVPEGCEDLQSVYECVPEVENYSPVHHKPRPFLSKSFDGGLSKNNAKPKKSHVHNVDEQLRHKHEKELIEAKPPPPPLEELLVQQAAVKKSEDFIDLISDTTIVAQQTSSPNNSNTFRNKYIINCESTVFEHTGVSYENGQEQESSVLSRSVVGPSLHSAAGLPPAAVTKSSAFPSIPFRQKLSNIIKSFRDNSADFESSIKPMVETPREPTNLLTTTTVLSKSNVVNSSSSSTSHHFDLPMSMESSMISDISTSTNNSGTTYELQSNPRATSPISNSSATGVGGSNAKNRHLASPMRKKSLTTRLDRPARMSPDLFGGRDITKINLSEEFDDILTITTTTDDPTTNDGSDIVIVDYPPSSSEQLDQMANNLLKPPPSSTSSSKTSLINRFLRNVTQKKIQDATIKKNSFFAAKVKTEKKLFENIYVKGVRPKNPDLIEDLNAEIALEMELSGVGGTSITSNMEKFCNPPHPSKSEFGLGVGEIAVDVFLSAKRLHIFRDDKEILMKVFKLYTGYSLEGFMTPVLVFLTDKTLYVTDLIRNRLFNKFVLPYTELDVILIGPYGNTVLLSNSARDMQQVLLAGGPYPADGLVSSLEMCARRGGSILPAVGQLTMDHLAPLQTFVRENTSVAKNDPWVYYAVVSVPANVLSHDVEPMGPHIKGPLMYRNVSSATLTKPWQAGYFLLKAGVLYMFNDAHQKIPTMVLALHECKGARRAVIANRPHCFELLLKTGFMQLAAPDEYVASEWLQALVQAASGLFEMQEKHKVLGCTLVMTSNHLITLREDFTAPLRRVNATGIVTSPAKKPQIENNCRKLSTSTITDTYNETISNVSSSTKFSDSRMSSNRSSPSRSGGASPYKSKYNRNDCDEKSFTSMSSIYGKNSGLEIKTCAALQEISTVHIPAQGDSWWCILEFSCQEVRENSDDMVIFFATNSDMRRFLSMLETIWQSKNDIPFPISILTDGDSIGSHCSELFLDINKSWDPLISAALGFPQ